MLEAIVLAGGFGTRLRGVLPNLPKPMAPVAGRPFLEILLGTLAQKKFERVVLSLGFMADAISSHFGDRFAGMTLVYAVESQPLGTGGAVRAALSRCNGDPVFVFNGDTYLDLEVDVVEQHWQRHRHAIVVGRQVPDTARFGRLVAVDGQLAALQEKGVAGPGLINAGCYVFSRGQLDAFEYGLPFSLEADYLARAGPESRVDVFVTAGQFIDIGIPEDLLRAQTALDGCH